MQGFNNNIGIIGVGAIGQALSKVFCKADNIYLWDIEKSKCNIESKQQLIDKANIIFLALPSWAVKQVSENISADKSKIIITVAKGVENDFVLMSTVLRQQSNSSFQTGVLYGPMLAAELVKNKPTQMVVACSDPNWHKVLSSLSTPNVSILHSFDEDGVATCGVLKNIYSVALGICDGLLLGNNAKGVLVTKILFEMRQVLKDLNQKPELAISLVGIGDLLATGFSKDSFNHKVGIAIAKGEKVNSRSSEGVNAILEINKKINIKNHLVLNALYECIKKPDYIKQFDKVIEQTK